MDTIMMIILEEKRMLRLGLFLCLIVFPVFVQAAEVTEADVRSAVQTWVRHVTADAKPDAFIERMEPYIVDGKIVAYIAHIAGGGFCLCGQDDLVLPVYLYSPEGTFDPENPGYQYILSEIAERTRLLVKASRQKSPVFMRHERTLQEREKMWQDLIAGHVPIRKTLEETPEAEPTMMDLGLTSRWHQRHPYSDQCPYLTSTSERTAVGCQGTAFSQIMYYWKRPHTGTGSKTITYYYRYRTNWDSQALAVNPDTNRFPGVWRGRLDWTSAYGGTLWMTGYWDGSIYSSARNISTNADYLTALEALYNRLTSASRPSTANFAAATYDWSILQDIHQDPSDPGDVEVAELCHHAAIANESGFGVDGTGSDWWRVDGPSGGLAQHLRYDGDSTYTSPRDIDMMVEEIQWLRPFGMGGGPPGHAWVILGYNKGTDPWQFKMNMGWGDPSGWYSLDNVPRDINQNHNHLTHIAPAGVVLFVGGGVSGDGSPQDPYANVEEAVQNAPGGTTLIFKAGSNNTFVAASLIVDRPLTLKGKNVTIRKQ